MSGLAILGQLNLEGFDLRTEHESLRLDHAIDGFVNLLANRLGKKTASVA